MTVISLPLLCFSFLSGYYNKLKPCFTRSCLCKMEGKKWEEGKREKEGCTVRILFLKLHHSSAAVTVVFPVQHQQTPRVYYVLWYKKKKWGPPLGAPVHLFSHWKVSQIHNSPCCWLLVYTLLISCVLPNKGGLCDTPKVGSKQHREKQEGSGERSVSMLTVYT